MAARNYVNGAPLLTLNVAVNTADVTLEVSSTAGFPPVPFTMALERGTTNEEVVLCTALNATTFTVTRGWDNTTAKSHSIGAAIEHTTAAIDYVEANDHVNENAADVHSQYVLKSEFGAKGRILVGTGAGTFVDLPVGSNDEVLYASSGEASGVRWGQLPGLSIPSNTVSAAQLTDSTEQSLIARQGSAPTAVTGRIYYNTSDGRWYGYKSGWKLIPFGAGQITVSTGAPSGGSSGDLWFRY